MNVGMARCLPHQSGMVHPEAILAEYGPVPDSLGPFRLRGRLGRGGMAVVFDAFASDGRPVALKVMPIRSGPRGGRLAGRFLREARLLAGVEDGGIVRLLGAGSIDDLLYLAMERIEGASLHDVVSICKLDCDSVLYLGERLANTLHRVHCAGVVHRDVKPANVLVDKLGNPVLIDFGIATYGGATVITRDHDILGTLGYIAPEVLDGNAASPLADQYSLGRVLFTMATGHLEVVPKDRERVKRLLAGLKIDWSLFPDGGRWMTVQAVIQRMVEADASRRFPNLGVAARTMRELRSPSSEPEKVLALLAGMATGCDSPQSTVTTTAPI